MGKAEVANFLSHLATARHVAANTQNQALNALVFVYKAILDRPLRDIRGVARAKKPQRLPTVLTLDEAGRTLANLNGAYWLIGCLQ